MQRDREDGSEQAPALASAPPLAPVLLPPEGAPPDAGGAPPAPGFSDGTAPSPGGTLASTFEADPELPRTPASATPPPPASLTLAGVRPPSPGWERWNKAGGKVDPGLVNRRKSEARVYLEAKY